MAIATYRLTNRPMVDKPMSQKKPHCGHDRKDNPNEDYVQSGSRRKHRCVNTDVVTSICERYGRNRQNTAVADRWRLTVRLVLTLVTTLSEFPKQLQTHGNRYQTEKANIGRCHSKSDECRNNAHTVKCGNPQVLP